MNNLIHRSLLIILVLGAISSSFAFANENDGQRQDSNTQISEISDSGLSVSAWVTPSEDIFVSQQLELNIEVAVENWFTGGTKIDQFEVDDMVILRREKFAVNSTRELGNKEWSVQLWTINLYPQRGGNYKIPPIKVDVQVADANGISVAKSIFTEEIPLTAKFPQIEQGEMFDENGALLVTGKFSLRDQYDRDLENLSVGDAIQRVVEIQADDLAAMMLPRIEMPVIDGLAIYREPVVLLDSSNRGVNKATRRETFNLLVEKPGSYELPAISVQWWNTNDNSLRAEELVARTINTTGAASERSIVDQLKGNSTSFVILDNWLRALLIGSLGALFSFFIIAGLKRRHAGHDSSGLNKELAELKALYRKYCKQGDYASADKALTRWLHLKLKSLEDNYLGERFSLREVLIETDMSGKTLTQYELLTSLAYAKENRILKVGDKSFELSGLLQNIDSEIGAFLKRQKYVNDESFSYEQLRP